MPNSNGSQYNCVLCEAELPSKQELQDHFRKHANKEIDYKGMPTKPKIIPRQVAVPHNKATRSTASGSSKMTKQGKGSTEDSSSVNNTAAKKAQPICCDVCTQQFETVTQAIQHKFRKHPNSPDKFFCGYCGMLFPLKISRDTHLSSTHPEPRPKDSFPCTDCNVVFHTREAMNYHYKSTHKRIVSFFKPVVTPPPSKKIRVNNAGEVQSVFYCHLCGYEYIVKFNLQKHLERQHSEEERNMVLQDLIKCTRCDALFCTKKAYDSHNMYHRPDDLYVTSEEQRLQTVTRVDQDFDFRRVQTPVEKFIPTNRPRPATQRQRPVVAFKSKLLPKEQGQDGNSKEGGSDSELSPDSSIPSSDSDSDAPLSIRLQHRAKRKKVFTKTKKMLKVSTVKVSTRVTRSRNKVTDMKK